MNTTTTTATTKTAPKWMAYYRVSTKGQGLGLEAQRAIVERAAEEAGATIVGEIEEKESGKECSRPGLNRALATARKAGAIVVVAKHDRLSRDLGFASNMVFKSGIGFNILNLPSEAMTDPLLFGVYFGMAMREAQLISERTTAALQALKAKGVKLGNPNGAKCLLTDEAKAAAAEERTRKALENPNNVASANEVRRYLNTEGNKKTLQAIADHLTESGYYTSRGVFHTPTSVKNLCRLFSIDLKKLTTKQMTYTDGRAEETKVNQELR